MSAEGEPHYLSPLELCESPDTPGVPDRPLGVHELARRLLHRLSDREQRLDLLIACQKMRRGLLRMSIGSFRMCVASGAFIWKWRFYFGAMSTGLVLAFLGAQVVAWVRAPLHATPKVAVDLPARSRLDERYTGEMGDLVHRCAPGVAPNTILAIMRTESSFNPLAMHVNGSVRLQHAPQTTAEAIEWSGWLIRRGDSVDMGLMQINSRNLGRLHMSVADAFDPCRNVHAAAVILTEQFKIAAQLREDSSQALLAAISAYNTGNFRDGLRNGYVSRVLKNATTP